MSQPNVPDLIHGNAADVAHPPSSTEIAARASTFAVGPAVIAKDKDQRTLILLAAELSELSAACGWLALSADVAGYQAKLGGINAGLLRINQRLKTLLPEGS